MNSIRYFFVQTKDRLPFLELSLLEAEREQSYRQELQVSIDRVRGLERGLGEAAAFAVPESQRERSREDRIDAIKSQLVEIRAESTRELARFTAYLHSDAGALSRAVHSNSWPPNTTSLESLPKRLYCK